MQQCAALRCGKAETGIRQWQGAGSLDRGVTWQGPDPQYLGETSRMDPGIMAKLNQEPMASGSVMLIRQVRDQCRSMIQPGMQAS